MKCENAANIISEFTGKVLHHAGRSDPPAVLTYSNFFRHRIFFRQFKNAMKEVSYQQNMTKTL